MAVAIRVAIAGCGPAGLAAALLLVRDGHEVVIYDRFPAPQPLGSGLMLQPSGMAVLAHLGLSGRIIQYAARIDRLLGRCVDGRTVLDARYDELPGPPSQGLGIHRASLFDILLDAVTAEGVPLMADREVTSSTLREKARWLEFKGGDMAGPFDLVIDALGLHTPLAPPRGRSLPFGALWTTLPWPQDGPFQRNRLEQRYRAARYMVGVLPTGTRRGHGEELSLFWSLPADGYDSWLAGGLAKWRAEVTALWPECAELVAQVTDQRQLTMACYAHRSLPSPAEDRLIHIGDAWHTASPQLGQGANMALLDAFAVAEAARLTGDPRLIPALAVQLRGWHVALYQRATAFFTPLYQSNAAFPAWLRDTLLAPASRHWPGKQVQALLMSGLTGNPLRQLGLQRLDYRQA